MKRCITSSRRAALAVFATLGLMTSGSVLAQSVDQVIQADQRRLELARQSQERINDIVEGTRSLEDDYRAINKEIDGLRVYNRLMQAQVAGQEATLADIEISMQQVDVINRQIFPLMVRMIDGLERSIALDVPFLMEERTERVRNLRDIMDRSDVSVAEKFRKVMEAYQIENDYGSFIDTYEQTLTVEGETRNFQILRIGRIGLYFQSEDEAVTGLWDHTIRDYRIDNSGALRREVKKGLAIAEEQIAPELLRLPVQGPTPAEAS